MKVLLIGGRGCDRALAWKLTRISFAGTHHRPDIARRAVARQ